MIYSSIDDAGITATIKPVSLALDLINRFMFVSAYTTDTNLYYIYRFSMDNTNGSAVTLESPNNYYDDKFIAAKAGATGSIAVHRKHCL